MRLQSLCYTIHAALLSSVLVSSIIIPSDTVDEEVEKREISELPADGEFEHDLDSRGWLDGGFFFKSEAQGLPWTVDDGWVTGFVRDVLATCDPNVDESLEFAGDYDNTYYYPQQRKRNLYARVQVKKGSRLQDFKKLLDWTFMDPTRDNSRGLTATTADIPWIRLERYSVSAWSGFMPLGPLFQQRDPNIILKVWVSTRKELDQKLALKPVKKLTANKGCLSWQAITFKNVGTGRSILSTGSNFTFQAVNDTSTNTTSA